ncbi:hypothetical protein RRG08_064943 [Elysia crispata]|uniref:Uncharacterized protein n=1 Tax=Elysia crispata TaxID=231223 RepID=A0AAE1DQX1_9GAST|nr:hypothetical protein RRG08_064943 [Elysia crispata]
MVCNNHKKAGKVNDIECNRNIRSTQPRKKGSQQGPSCTLNTKVSESSPEGGARTSPDEGKLWKAYLKQATKTSATEEKLLQK